MNDSIFEENTFGMDNHADAPEEEDEMEAMDMATLAEMFDDEEEDEDDASVDDQEEDEDEDQSSSPGRLLELLTHMRDLMSDDDEEEEDMDECDMDADDYHNSAVDRARRGKKREAAQLCMDGLKKFPLNVDLLADTIMYSSEAGDLENAAQHYAILKASVPFRRWNWRAFSFAMDYLLDTDPIGNEEDCRLIVENYKRYLPFEEKASMAESKLEAALGNVDDSMKVLVEAIRTHTNASQCALRLADMQMERGLFEDVLNTANYGIAASAETQPSISIPYLYFIRALAKDHLLHRKECNGEPIKKDEVKALKDEYELLLAEFPELMRHSNTIKMRVKMLKFIKAE